MMGNIMWNWWTEPSTCAHYFQINSTNLWFKFCLKLSNNMAIFRTVVRWNRWVYYELRFLQDFTFGNKFQRTYNFENVILDAENFPPYLPERRGYSQMKFFKKTKNSLILRSAILCFFEIKSKAAKRFKTNNGNWFFFKCTRNQSTQQWIFTYFTKINFTISSTACHLNLNYDLDRKIIQTRRCPRLSLKIGHFDWQRNQPNPIIVSFWK